MIDSGLDIANVNTLIVEDADRMGLAQLYQLRGRVGRSHRMAYAFFTYRPQLVLREAVEKRLQAIKDFTELGSGFKLAMRDMEIRGAGNILGAEQHGFIISVGFDLYTQLLAEAIRELRGEQGAARLKPAVDLHWDAYLPDGYVGESRRKIEFYKRIEESASRQDLADLRDELVDRYGEPPAPARNLFTLAEIRRRAAEAGVLSIVQNGSTLRFELIPWDPADLKRAGLADPRRRRRFSGDANRPVVTVDLRQVDRRSVVQAVQEVLHDLTGLLQPAGKTPVLDRRRS
ncbi:MAG: TRCF domain-containing protein [Thermaerobacterales bacterium]